MKTNSNISSSSIFTLSILACVWGSSFILIKQGLISFDPYQVGTLRIVFASLVLMPIAIKNIKIPNKKDWFYLFIVGAIGNLIPAFLFSVAETKLSSSLTGILNSLTPIFTLLISFFIFKNNIRKPQIIGVIIGLLGSIGISFINAAGNLGTINFYTSFVILATIFYGISVNTIKSRLAHINSLKLTSLALFTVGPISIVYLFTTNFIDLINSDPAAQLSLFYIFLLGFVGTALALILFNKLIHNTNAVFASSVTYLIPIVAIVWGLIDGEIISIYHVVGMAIIILGVYNINKN